MDLTHMPPGIAFMRHCSYTEEERQTFLVPGSMNFALEQMDKLLQNIHHPEIRIFHSPLERAMLTANVLRTPLVVAGRKVSATACLTLSEDRTVTNGFLQGLLDDEGGGTNFFALLITHEPVIEDYFGYYAPQPVRHCSIFSRDFLLPGHLIST